ncbi:MAG: hypothetical protein GY834_10755 [Bacteroidetes bacterium]|nr:hypothetical protein [Bacteroidota bacterium]
MGSTNITDIIDTLVNTAHNLIKWKILAGMSIDHESLPPDYWHFNHKVLDEVIDLIKPLLAKAQQVRELEARNASDVIKILKLGKITVSEATELLTMMRAKLEVEELEQQQKMAKELMSKL